MDNQFQIIHSRVGSQRISLYFTPSSELPSLPELEKTGEFASSENLPTNNRYFEATGGWSSQLILSPEFAAPSSVFIRVSADLTDRHK